MTKCKYTSRQIRRILGEPGATRMLNESIVKVYKDLGFLEKSDVDNLGKIIQTNMKEKHGIRATKFHMGEVSYAELAIRLTILLMQLDCDAAGLREWIQENK